MCESECVAEDARARGSAERGNDWSFLLLEQTARLEGEFVPRAGYPTFNLISGLRRRRRRRRPELKETSESPSSFSPLKIMRHPLCERPDGINVRRIGY